MNFYVKNIENVQNYCISMQKESLYAFCIKAFFRSIILSQDAHFRATHENKIY